MKWEYRIFDPSLFSGSEKQEQQLNQLGEEGWDLAGYCQAGAATFILKRPKPN